MDATTIQPQEKIASRVQFTLSNALLILLMIGMADLVLHDMTPMGYLAVAGVTAIGGFIGIYLGRNDQTIRNIFVVFSIATTWALTFVAFTAFQELTRPMSRSETAPAAACKAFAEAEEIYHRHDYTGNNVLKYAPTLQYLFGSSGELALIDKTFALAEIGHVDMRSKAGYVFKVLTAQGPHATGGRRSYIDENGNMTLGYALIAVPANWGETGRDSYMINNNGTIFQRDLGPYTSFIASSLTEFDPDTNWVPTQ